MTENESKDKLCPLMACRPMSFCVGSNCMAWRWNEPMFNGEDSYVSEPGPTGYCGLAGKEVSE